LIELFVSLAINLIDLVFPLSYRNNFLFIYFLHILKWAALQAKHQTPIKIFRPTRYLFTLIQVQQKPVQNNNMAIQPNGRNMDSKIPNQLPVNNGTTTATNVLQQGGLQQNMGQLNKMGSNPVSNQHGNETLSMQNPLTGSSNNKKQSSII